MEIAVQMDPIDSIHTYGDSTFALMLEAQSRGFDIWIYEPKTIVYKSGRISAEMTKISVVDQEENYYSQHEQRRRDLNQFPVLLMRQDPPFDMGYYTNTFFLEMLDGVKVFNNPGAVRNVPEKFSALQLHKFMPPTMVARDKAQIIEFCAEHDQIVLKPASGFGGEQVVKTHKDDPQLEQHIDNLLDQSIEPILAQMFLPGVAKHDKRVMMMNGKVIGVLGRIPPEGEFVANIHSGGQPVLSQLTPDEEKMCEEIGPLLNKWGIFFAGIDLIDGYLSEINVTSPTLMRELKRLGGPDVAKIYWDEVLKSL